MLSLRSFHSSLLTLRPPGTRVRRVYPGVTILAVALFASCLVSAQPRMDTIINNDWKFLRADAPGAEAISYPDQQWQDVSLPHTWNALDGQDGGNDYYRGIGWYRKNLVIPSRVRGKSLFLKFDAAATAAEVFVNGKPAVSHTGGFGAFCVEITPFVQFDASNIVAVKVSNAPDSTISPLRGDFTIFGGLYRDVHLIMLEDVSVSPTEYASPGVFLRQQYVTPERADVEVTTILRNSSARSRPVTVRCSVTDRRGAQVLSLDTLIALGPRSQRNAVQRISLTAPHLWNGRTDPYLYKVSIDVLDGPILKDQVVQPLGLRFFRIDPGAGFILNGRGYHLHGVNRHQDRENLGWAIGQKEFEEDYRLIEELGCTALRLAHYQHAQAFYDLCDNGGMIVWAELALVDEIHPSPEFSSTCRRQLIELIKQNYNHPSIVMWSMFNELIPDRDRPLYGTVVSELNALAKQLDPTRLTVAASRGNYDGAEPINSITDVIGYNLYKGWYESSPEDLGPSLDTLHRRFPHSAVCISEYGAGAGTSQHEVPPRHPDPAGPWHPEEWQAHVHEVSWAALTKRPFVWGTFVWNMFDFASDGRGEGERPGRNDKGLVTADRKVKKDAFFLYKAHWNPEPMVYITSRRYASRLAGETEVRVYSNCDSVFLTVNGKPVRVQPGSDRIFVWKNITLVQGENLIEVRGVERSKEVEDECIWTAK